MEKNKRVLEGKLYPIDLLKKIKNKEIELGSYTSVNEDGEDVIVSIKEKYLRTDTIQSNGWIRINCYYLDGTKTETFTR